MTSTQNLPQSASKPTIEQSISQCRSLSELKGYLRTHGCSGCVLGAHSALKGPVLYRGNPEAKIMAVGEAPGKEEDRDCSPFVGPAGKLLDRIFAAVGINTEQDCYLCNICSCRPIAEIGSGKQNNTPSKEHVSACKPLLYHQINIVNPNYIVLVGGSAIKALFPKLDKVPVKSLVGKFYLHEDFPGKEFFGIYHPAAIIRAGEGTDYNLQLRQTTWENMKLLKNRIG